jgi:hypothetical protein
MLDNFETQLSRYFEIDHQKSREVLAVILPLKKSEERNEYLYSKYHKLTGKISLTWKKQFL